MFLQIRVTQSDPTFFEKYGRDLLIAFSILAFLALLALLIVKYNKSFQNDKKMTVSMILGNTIETAEVQYGSLFVHANPEKEGFVFKGWYTDSVCITAYDSSQPVKTDLVLYAKFDKES